MSAAGSRPRMPWRRTPVNATSAPRPRASSIERPTAQAPGGTTTLAYDTAGNVASRTDPLGHATTYTYDAQGRVLTETDARDLEITSKGLEDAFLSLTHEEK